MKLIKKRGGGGGQPPTVESIPDWMRPYVQNVGDQAEQLYGSGQLSRVANQSGLQGMAFGTGAQAMTSETGEALGEMELQKQRLRSAAGSGGYDTGALKSAAIQEAGMETAQLGTQYGASGTLGSGRQMVRQGAADAATAAKFAQIDQQAEQQNFQNKMTAEQALGSNVSGSTQLASQFTSGMASLGDQQRTIDQQQQDAPWQALQRYASTIYGNPARQSAGASGGK